MCECVSVQDDSTVKCWGENAGNGQLGLGDSSNWGDSANGPCPPSSSSLLLASLELSDTQVYEPSIRARLAELHHRVTLPQKERESVCARERERKKESVCVKEREQRRVGLDLLRRDQVVQFSI